MYTTVLPDTSKIAAGIKSAFRAVDDDAYQAGRRWGREIQRGIGDVTVDLKVDASKAKAQLKDAAKDQAATIEVDADTAKAEMQIDFAARDRKVNIEVDSDRLAGSVEAAAPAMVAQAASTGGQMGSSMGGAMQGPLMAAGIAALAGIASAASGALAIIPAGIAGAGSVIGTLAVGLDGVKDAWDAAGKASKSSGTDQASQAKSVASAQKTLSGAVKDEERAQKDVANARKQARQQLADLNLELRGGALDVKQAQLDAQQAREDLASGTYETSTQYQQAQLRVLQADQRVAEATDRQGKLQSDANEQRAKGVEGADQVVAANDRVADAHQRVADAQTNLNDAATKTSSAADAAAQAMAALSPQAQNFVNALTGLKPAFDSFKMAVQDALFANLGPQLQQLAGQYLPILQTAFTGLAGTINESMSGLMSWLGQPETMAAMQTIFANIGSSFQIWSQALKPVSDAFLTITQVGSTFLPQLADMAVKAANAFNDFIQNAAATGQLSQWMQLGIDTLGQLGDVATQLTQIFLALAPVGPPVLSLMNNYLAAIGPQIPGIAQAYADWVAAITPLMSMLAQLAASIMPALTGAVDNLNGSITTTTGVFSNLSGPIGTVADAIERLVNDTPALKTFFDSAYDSITRVLNPLQQFADIYTAIHDFITGDNTAKANAQAKLDAARARVAAGGSAADPALGGGGSFNGPVPGLPAAPGSSPASSGANGVGWGRGAGGHAPAATSSRAPLGISSDPLYVQVLNAVAGGGAAGVSGWVGGSAAPATGGGGASSSVASSIGPVTISPSVAKAAGAQPIYTPGTTTLPQWVNQLAGQFNLTASTYADGGSLHQGGYAVDFNGAPADMERFAQYVQSNLAGQTLQLIYQAQSGQKYGIAGGQAVGPGTSSPGYYASDFAGHQDHVHWATDAPAGFGAGTGAGTGVMPTAGMPTANITQLPTGGAAPASLTASSTKDQVAQAIIAEAQKRGYTREQTIAVLSTAMQESGLSPGASGGGGAWHGIFQQDSSYPGRDDPSTNISEFFKRVGAPGSDIWSQIFGLQQGTPYTSPGARKGYMSEIQSQSGAASSLYDRLAPAAGAPTGTPQDPLNIQLSPNIPAGQRKGAGSASSGGQQLGQDFVSGIMEIFGLGDLFPDPTQFGLVKLFKAVMGLKPAAGGQGQVRGGDGASLLGGMGGGGDLLSGALSLIPQPFGQLHVGSPGDAPTPFMPSMPRSGASSGGLGGMMANNTPGQGNVVDQRVDLSGSKFGYSPTQVQDQIRSGQMAATRQPIRHLPS